MINSENTILNRSNITWYNFYNIKNNNSSEFDDFLSDDEKIAFLIFRWITFSRLRLCYLLLKLFITSSKSLWDRKSLENLSWTFSSKSEKIASINASHFSSKWIFISSLCEIDDNLSIFQDFVYLYAWNTSLFFVLFKKFVHELFFASLIALKYYFLIC